MDFDDAMIASFDDVVWAIVTTDRDDSFADIHIMMYTNKQYY